MMADFTPRAQVSNKTEYCTWEGNCPRLISDTVAKYSKEKYGKPLCWGHQKRRFESQRGGVEKVM